MPRQTLEIDAKVGAAVAELMKVVKTSGQIEQSFKRVAVAGTNGMRQVEREVARLDAASMRASRAVVAGIRRQTTGGSLALSAVDRAMRRSSTMSAAAGTELRGLQDIALQRRLLAQGLRGRRADDQAFARFLALERAEAGIGAASTLRMTAEGQVWAKRSAARLAARDARYAAAATSAVNAAGIGFLAGGGMMTGDDAIMRRARRDVARNVAGTPELAGKVGPDDLETMTRVRADSMRRQQEMRQRIAGGAMYVGAALTGIGYAAEQELNRYADTIVGFEDTLAPLYGVGQNMQRRPRIRREVLAASTGFGIDPAQIAGLRFSLESAASDLPSEMAAAVQEEAIKYWKLQRSDMQSVALAMIGGLQLAKGELPAGAAGVRALSSKLGYAADVGAFEVDQFTPYQSDILGAFKGMGYTVDDALAAAAVASKSGMRPEKWATAVRNLALIMPQARQKLAKEGVTLPQDFGGAVAELGKVSGPKLEELFGRDPFVAIQILTRNAALLEQYRRGSRAQTGRSDFVGAKVGQAWLDPMYGTAEIIRSARVGQANAPMQNVESAGLAGPLEEWELRKLGAAREVHPALSWLGRLGVWAESVSPQGGDSSYLAAGVREAANQARAAGNTFLADYLELKFGEQAGSSYQLPSGKKRYTRKDDAETFRRLRTEMGFGDLSAGEFREYLRLGEVDKKAAESYLHRFGKGPAAGGDAGGDAPLIEAAALLRGAADKLDLAGGAGGTAPPPKAANIPYAGRP
jgi:hypothetical protein